MKKIKLFFKNLFKTSNYVSELDRFLKAFDKNHPKLSKSQALECEKYNRIYQLRDNKITVTSHQTLWNKF